MLFNIESLTRTRKNPPRDWSDSASCQSLSRAAEATCKLRWFPIETWHRPWHSLALVGSASCSANFYELKLETEDWGENITSPWEKIQQVELSWAWLRIRCKSPQMLKSTHVSLWKTSKVLEQSELSAIELNANEPSCNDALPCITTTGQGLQFQAAKERKMH